MNFSFLRPLGPPRPSTLRAFLSTTTKASSAAAPTTTTSQPIATIPIIAPKTLPFTPATISKSSPTPGATLPYHVSRTGSKSLPIYLVKKRGGNLHQTKLRKITGNIQVLRQELQDFLGMEKSEVAVNALTNHIIIRGFRKERLEKFLLERNF